MSNIVLSSNPLGTGTLTVASPNTNTNRTLTLPDNSGTLLSSTSTSVLPKGMPCFSAYQTVAQTPSVNTQGKVNLQAKEFDYTTAFDTTLSRFTPQVAGVYQINGCVRTGGSVGMFTSLYKNGSIYKGGNQATASAAVIFSMTVSALVYMNGTTDYVELYIYSNTSVATQASVEGTYLNGVLVRAD